jgi:anti-anti-sigma factor
LSHTEPDFVAEEDSGGLRVHLRGELRVDSVAALKGFLVGLPLETPRIVLDCSELDAVDAASLQLLLAFQRSRPAGQVRLESAGPAVRTSLAAGGFTPHMAVEAPR